MLETNRISELLESYIEYKHSLGFEIKQEISVLRNFQRLYRSINKEYRFRMDFVWQSKI